MAASDDIKELIQNMDTLGIETDNIGDDYATYGKSEVVPDPYTILPTTTDPREQKILQYGRWRLSPLYKKDARGSMLSWWVGYDATTGELLMTHGHVGGKIRTNTSKVVLNQSGKNLHFQALQEAKQRYTEKYRNEFYRQPGEEAGFFTKPMLANVWKPTSTRLRYPVLVQPKLDGARCLARMEGDKVSYRARSDVKWGHLNEEFDDEIIIFLTYIPYICELDGEVYKHGASFSRFSSILKNMKFKDPEIKTLTYYIYDFNTPDPLPMEQRWAILDQAKKQYEADGNKRTRFDVLFTATAQKQEDIMTWHAYFLEQGFEGTMIRKIAGPNPTAAHLKESLYKSDRGNNLLKHKDFDDTEGLVVGVKNAEGTEEGCAILTIRCTHQLPTGETVVTDIDMRPAFPFEERKAWFLNPDLVMGKLANYKYQGVSEYGVPRFPVVKKFRALDGTY
jgi:hypothetical protein